MRKHAFITVTDVDFFPGTLATVNSILEYHAETEVFVVNRLLHPLSPPQRECLTQDPRVQLLDSSVFELPERHCNAWELKAYAAADLCPNYEVIIGIDSDCLLCSNIHQEIELCFQNQGFMGGRDGIGVTYDENYSCYGMATPQSCSKYMSTSLFLCAVNDENQAILNRWAECCSAARFNDRGPYPGHGDQGVLNAVIFAANRCDDVHLLENDLWSQHWRYWDSIIDFRHGAFVNRSCGGRRQRSFHCGGAEKFWSQPHSGKVQQQNALQSYPYAWFLAMLWFGSLRRWAIDPCQYLSPGSHHLAEDLVTFFPQIAYIYPKAREIWDNLTDPLIDRILTGIPRAMSTGGGSLTELIQLIAARPRIRRYVEIGSYEGGSILALALRFQNRDIDFYSVESFMGSLDGTMDGHRLPSRRAFNANCARFPTLRVSSVPVDSAYSGMFDDSSLDFVFVDGCHDTSAVIRDIDTWIPKLRPGGVIAGDDFGWESVKLAVNERFPHANGTPSGCVWWQEI